ncbi:MAG: histidine phosphatase family protein [Candidatus Magasanikbacteria bacterium]|nr:histidine phosphatase family protein [Candidatus Magasanikbacteria bacterium]
MGWPRNLVLVRHAESEGNVLTVDERARFNLATHAYGLTSRGQEQARLTGEYLKQRFGAFDTYYVSYYERSRQTMRIMFPEAHIFEDPRLAEANRGIYHVLTREEIAQHYFKELESKDREGLYHHRPPQGENWPDVEQRIHSFLGTLRRDCKDENVLIVVHGHWALLFQRLIHHFPIDEAVRRYKQGNIFENASVTIYQGQEIKGCSRLVLTDENVIPWAGKI